MISINVLSISTSMNCMKSKITLNMALNLNLSVLQKHMRNCYTHTHLYVPHGRNNWYSFAYIWNRFILTIDPSGWKGSVSNGLGADISLPPCLATGIWNLGPKATPGPKSWGPSFGTTLWRHVQRYCAKFLIFMVIYGNPVLLVFCLRTCGCPREVLMRTYTILDDV